VSVEKDGAKHFSKMKMPVYTSITGYILNWRLHFVVFFTL